MQSVKEFQAIPQRHLSNTLALQNNTRFRVPHALKFNIQLSLSYK